VIFFERHSQLRLILNITMLNIIITIPKQCSN
jgi:hypothetical protein